MQRVIGEQITEGHRRQVLENLLRIWSEHRSCNLSELTLTWQLKSQELAKRGISCTTFLDPAYPQEFVGLEEPPSTLWSTQPLRKILPLRLAVIGSRGMTNYGARSTRELVGELVSNCSLSIISGCARGIDWVAHESAIRHKGQTIGILGCGIEQMPYYCKELSTNQHVIWISEFPPLASGAKWRFPFRNRLIAALSQGVLVIEGGEKSGTLITAGIARDLGKPVMVLSHNRDNVRNFAVRHLCKLGALPVMTAEHILEDLGVADLPTKPKGSTVLIQARNVTERLFLEQLVARGGRSLRSSLVPPNCVDQKTWENTRFELEARGVITERLGTCELTGMVQS